MHERSRTAPRRVPDGLIRLFGDDLAREGARDREIHVVLVQHACGEGDAVPLKRAVERNAAAAAADHKSLRRAAHRLKLQTAEAFVIAAGGQAVQALYAAVGKDLLGRADPGDLAVRHADDAVGDFLREVELMQRQHDGDTALAHQIFQNGQQLELVADVEKRGRLVEDEHARLLADGAREQHALPLSIADAGEIAVRKLLCMDERERLAHLFAVLRAENAEPPGIGIAACRRHIPAGHALGRDAAGHHDGERARGLCGGQTAAVAAVQIDRAAEQGKLADQTFEDSGLARAVRPDKG